MRSKRLGIWGWWQGNNLGDNWIKKVLYSLFPNAEFIDTSVQQFQNYEFVICGGGGLFVYDVIAPWNCNQKVSYGVIGLGAEFEHETKTAISVFQNAKFFYVRDQYSLDCMHLYNVERSYDLTFSLPLHWSENGETNPEKVFFVWRDGHELLSNFKFKEYIKPGKSYQDWKTIIDKYFTDIVEDDFQTKDDNIEERINDSGFIISGRYHGIIAAIQRGIPFIAIDICPKIRALLEECGLEEYCVKISDVDKVPNLIVKARNNIDDIRKKEKSYVKTASKVLTQQIINAKVEVLKVLNPLSVIHYGSYWMKDNDVVNTMADDLGKVCQCKKIDLKAYSKRANRRIENIERTPNGTLTKLNHSKIVRDIKWHRADAIILNSGGLYLEDKTYRYLDENGVTSVGISLSDPDVYPYNGKIYAEKFNLFYTNSKYSYLNEYNKNRVNINILPFAASINHHFYMAEVERKYDVVVVAHAREDRIPVIKKLESICNVGIYGDGWEHSLGTVNGRAHVRAINSGKMYLSFAKTVAGFDNVKVGLFEAMACNQVVITYYMEELQDYFEIGKEILCYKSEDELYDLINWYLRHENELENIRKAGYHRFLRDHTYEKRWNKVLRDIYMHKGLL